jgi:branched-chain amino acid transport system substrate-binding protein
MRTRYLILLVLLSITIPLGIRRAGGGARQERVKIGVITVLTGENADYGAYTRNGLDLAMSERAGAPIDLIYEDSKANPQEAIRVFKELQARGIAAVIGPFTSTEVRAVGPEAQRAAVPLITSSATADDLSALGDQVFMMLPPNSKQGSDQATYARETLKAGRVAILFRDNPYGQTLREAFARRFKELGGQIPGELGFPDGTEDFRDRLRQLAETAPDAVFAPVHDADSGRILRQAREVGFPRVPFLGADGSMTATMLELAGSAAEGSIYSNVASVDASFDKRYQAKYGKAPSPYSASAFDTMMILADLVKGGAHTASAIHAGLIALHGYEGASGTTRFIKVDKSYWCLDKRYRQFIVKNGAFELVH